VHAPTLHQRIHPGHRQLLHVNEYLTDLSTESSMQRRHHGGSCVGKHPAWKKSGWAWPILEILAVVWKLPGNSLSMEV